MKTVYVIIEQPPSVKPEYTVRKWLIDARGNWVLTDDVSSASTLRIARGYIPDGFARHDRTDKDDPGVLEWWEGGIA